MKSRMSPGDLHAVVDGSFLRLYNRAGKLQWKCEARTVGSNGGPDVVGGDTPPGLYVAGLVTMTRDDEPESIKRSFGPAFVDLVEMENQEASRGRAGVGVHGGRWGVPTHGCVRLRNPDALSFAQRVVAVQKSGGKVWISVQ